VHLRPVISCTNPSLHGWLKEELAVILAMSSAPAEPAEAAATRAAWTVWQDGLAERFTLPELLRMLLVWDNLAGHKTAEMVVWLCQHGVMPLYTPLGGSWLNMAESSSASSSVVPSMGSICLALPRSALGLSRQPRPGTGSPRPLSGTASAGNDGASGAVIPTPSPARQL
jgi:hypothetical protein